MKLTKPTIEEIKNHLWSFAEHWNSIHSDAQITVVELQSYIETYLSQQREKGE
jgi:hypothetical protein